MKKLIFIFAACIAFASCKTETPYPDLTYKCECGSINWGGTAYELTDSHWVATAVGVTDLGVEFDLGKEYYTTTKVDIENEFEPHHYNMRIDIPDVTAGVQVTLGGAIFFDFAEDIFSVSMQEVNYNDISIVDEFTVVAGALELTPSLDGVTDEISFEFEIIQVINGSPAGFPFIYTGSLTSTKEVL